MKSDKFIFNIQIQIDDKYSPVSSPALCCRVSPVIAQMLELGHRLLFILYYFFMLALCLV